MVSGPQMPPAQTYLSASELAEYAYCPRAHYYSRTLSVEPPDPPGDRARSQGSRYHDRRSRSVRSVEAHAPVWLALLSVSAVGLAIVLGGWWAGWL